VGEKAAGDKAGAIPISRCAGAGEDANNIAFYFDPVRFFRAALAPSLPRAVRVLLGKCAIIRFRRADLAAFLMFRFAAARCFLVAISLRNK
jgi:hypothetical protein